MQSEYTVSVKVGQAVPGYFTTFGLHIFNRSDLKHSVSWSYIIFMYSHAALILLYHASFVLMGIWAIESNV